MKTDSHCDSIDSRKAELAGLRYHDVLLHQNRIKKVLQKDISPYIPVTDTCRLDNGGILKSAFLERWPAADDCEKTAAFVPAAGAASRYFQPIEFVREPSLLQKEKGSVAIKKLLTCPMPQYVTKVLCGEVSQPDAKKLDEALTLPKALQPATTDGSTFFELKLAEHAAIGIAQQVFVAPHKRSKDFQNAFDKSGANAEAIFLEQGPELCTLRFDAKGGAPVTIDGEYSLVPAGHGTLVNLFPKVRSLSPNVDSLFIRNIDNVAGLDESRMAFCRYFIKAHRNLLQCVRSIRQQLAAGNIEKAEQLAQTFASKSEIKTAQDETYLLALQRQLFHSPAALTKLQNNNLELLKTLYGRPVNLVGVVPNTGGDAGGAPVYCDAGFGKQKLLLEGPHASSQDKERFLADPTLATHFNPVFVCAEIPADPDAYHLTDSPFWILAKKTFSGREVVYHETVLYELLGNSHLANAIFVEIPRELFNPHKTVLDGCGHSDDYWKLPR
jgi:hypothetical protein